MRTRIPSTAALSAFEAAVRHQSFTKAADELAVTQSAICRQIASLEELVGHKLFRRTRRGVLVSEAGEAYAQNVRGLLRDIERTTRELTASGSLGGTLELGVTATFATNWLIPRLKSFQEQYPNITVNLSVHIRPFLFDAVPLDASIYSGREPWPGVDEIFLFDERVVAVGSPALFKKGPVKHPSELLAYPLLHQRTRPEGWRDWFVAQGVDVGNVVLGPKYELFSMQAKAASIGLGIALLPEFLIQDELDRGVLVRVSRYTPPSGQPYHLLFPTKKKRSTALESFRAWLVAEAKAFRDTSSVTHR